MTEYAVRFDLPPDWYDALDRPPELSVQDWAAAFAQDVLLEHPEWGELGEIGQDAAGGQLVDDLLWYAETFAAERARGLISGLIHIPDPLGGIAASHTVRVLPESGRRFRALGRRLRSLPALDEPEIRRADLDTGPAWRVRRREENTYDDGGGSREVVQYIVRPHGTTVLLAVEMTWVWPVPGEVAESYAGDADDIARTLTIDAF